jgi:NAD(P)-dependent dehydrogenase (short-subunit alcohol dehydrogenase family)
MTKYIVLTGGSRGIGEATIKLFTEAGWQAVNLSRTPCKIPGVKNFTVDLSEPELVEKMEKQLKDAVPNATTICLVHNAGCQAKDTVEDVSLAEIRRTFNVNVVSSSLLNKMFIPLMKPGSSVLYLGSMLADRGVPGNASYIMSKHAVLGLMRATCQDLVGRKITTCCICPGLVDTKLLKDSMSDELVQHLLNTYVIGQRLIDPSEIAQVIFDCAHSAVINGAIVPANLGLVAS